MAWPVHWLVQKHRCRLHARFNLHCEVSQDEKFSEKENTMNAVILIDGILYAGISIIVFVGVLTMGMGVVAGK